MKRKKTAKKHIPRGLIIAFIVGWLVVIGVSAALIWRHRQTQQTLTATDNNVKLVVDSITYDETGQEPFVPRPGWKFAIVEVTVTNEGKRSFDFAPVLQTYLVGSQEQQFGLAPAQLDNPIKAGPIKPGQTVSGAISYMVPVAENNLTLNFTAN